MPAVISGRRFIRQSISLRDDQLIGAKRIVITDGHGNLSRLMQDLLEDELRRRYGRDWQRELGLTEGVIDAPTNGRAA